MKIPDHIPTGKPQRVDAPANAVMVSVPAAARLVGLCPATLWKLVGKGTIPSHRYGSRRLIHRTDLERWAAALPERRAS